MSLRCVRSIRPAVLVLFCGALLAVSLLWSATAGLRAGAATSAPSGGQAPLTLLWQTATVQPPASGPASFTLDLGIGTSVAANAQVGLTLYRPLTSPSRFQQTLNSTSVGTPLTHIDPVAVSSLPTGQHRGVALAMDVVPSETAAAAPAAGTPTLDLRCTSTNRSCTGVYPVVVALYRPGQGGPSVAHFTTYLTYVQDPSTATASLRFAWVVPMANPVEISEGVKDPATAVRSPSTATVDALAGLTTSLTEYSDVPVTMEASPQTLQALYLGGGTGRQAEETVSEMSRADPSTRQIPAQPYVPIDLGAFAAAGERGEVTGQMTQGTTVLRSLQVAASSHTWVATGSVGSALGTGLAYPQVGADQVVVPEDQLASGTTASTFQLSFAKGTPSITAAASDSELATIIDDSPKDPALEAAQLLSDLAMVHFEAPFTPTPHGLVAVPPTGWQPNRTFDNALLAGLSDNPIVTPLTLSGFFSSVHDAGARHLQSSGTGPSLPRSLARQISTSRLHLTGFDTAVRPKSTPVLTQLDQLLLSAEADNLSTTDQATGVTTFAKSLDAQLSQVTFATTRSITLTARTGSIPITIVSHAPYTVVGTLMVSSDKIQFPQGSSRQLTVNHATTPVRIQVEARTSGDLPIQAQLQAADGTLVIAQGQLTVRSTATSIVGIILTVLALAVLLAWWARTWRAGRRKRAVAKVRRTVG